MAFCFGAEGEFPLRTKTHHPSSYKDLPIPRKTLGFLKARGMDSHIVIE